MRRKPPVSYTHLDVYKRQEFKYSNPMQVARVQKVVVSMGVGAAARDSKLIEGAVKDLTLITGQKPKITKAKKSVAQFHLLSLIHISLICSKRVLRST